MRKELNLMETIENYINGNLTEEEKILFEKQLSSNPELQKEVALQRDLIKGIERMGLKQSIKTSKKKFNMKKNFKNWGVGGLTVGIVVIGIVAAIKFKTPNENAPQHLPELNEQGEKLWSNADKYLPLQSFELTSEQDTVIETKDGIVLAIPANCFLDEMGKPVNGSIDLEVKEALNAADIMKAGLSTKSGNNLLETGGMFYINARQNGKSLQINKDNGIYAQIPTDEVKQGMQLFEGKRLNNGTIDWINPKPMEKYLIPVDIFSLNFYPPNYLDSLNSWGYNAKDKHFTDSLYYSFAALFGEQSFSTSVTPASKGETLFKQNCSVCHSLGKDKITGPGLEGVANRVPRPADRWLEYYIKNNLEVKKSGDRYAKKLTDDYNGALMTVFTDLSDIDIKAIIKYIENPESKDPLIEISTNGYDKFDHSYKEGINPAKIKTIWSEEFQNTLIATKEFEERLPYIHRECEDYYLDLYINNLDKNLCTIDSVVAFSEGTNNREAFLKFASRGDGKVKNGDKKAELLKAYYRKKAKLFTEAITKTQREFWDKQNKLNQEATQKRKQYSQQEIQRLAKNYRDECDINLAEACNQLGVKHFFDWSNKYGAQITVTGWNNIDKYVSESVATRTTLDYTDPNTGQKAVIKYEPLSVSVEAYNNYDRVLVYLIPDKMNSFMKIENTNNVFEEKLNELLTYQLVCIAYKGEESFYYSQEHVSKGKMSVSLTESSNSEIKNKLNSLTNNKQSKAMKEELDYLMFEKEELKRQNILNKTRELTKRIEPVIFPCMARDRVYVSEK